MLVDKFGFSGSRNSSISPTVSLVGLLKKSGDIMYLDMNDNIIRHLPNPVLPQDSTTKEYVDSSIGGWW
jgi:hypothetical protein